MLLFKLFNFYLITLLSYFSIAGYGAKLVKTFEKSIRKSVSESFFYGLILVLPICVLKISFFNNNIEITILIFLIGLFFFLHNFKFKEFYLDTIILFAIFIGLLISKTHEDFYYYHLQFIREINNDQFVLGLAVADIKYIYGSSVAYLQSMYIFNEDYKYIHVPIFLFFSSCLIFFIFQALDKKNTNIEIFFSFFISILLLIKFKRVSEFGYDYIYHFIFFFIFFKFFIKEKKSNDLFFLTAFFIILIFIKPIAILLFPFYLFFILKIYSNFFKLRKIEYFKFIFLIILVLVFLINIFVKSGCLLIPSKYTCVENLAWSVNYKESNLKKAISWSKGFYHQDKNIRIHNEINYNKNYNWIKNWSQGHFKHKIRDYLGVLVLVFFLILVLNFNFSGRENELKNFYYLTLYFTSVLTLFLWFSIIPQFRFGISQITLVFFFTFYSFISKYIKFDKIKNLHWLIFFSLFVYILGNVLRINDEFLRIDQYKFVNFPYVNLRTVEHKKKETENFYYYYADKSDCINSRPICSTKDIIVKKSNIFLVLIDKNRLQ
jgi:hypothetical protein